MTIAVLGAGAWGTALACHLARGAAGAAVGAATDPAHDNPAVRLWSRSPAQAARLAGERINAQYLPGVALPATLEVTANLDAALAETTMIIVATPVSGLRGTFLALADRRVTDRPVVWLSKGLEADTGLLPHQVAQAVMPQAPVGVLSGPSFAQEVAAQVVQAVVAACHRGAMRVYGSDDLVGVGIAGAMKNVVAIAAGIGDGLALGANARAALMTRGLAEIARLGEALGARQSTFMGLAGMGDLVLTCAGDLSRNRQVGLALARGEGLADIVRRLGHVAEGVPCARAATALGRSLAIELPIADAVCAILDGRATPRQALAELIARDPRTESAS